MPHLEAGKHHHQVLQLEPLDAWHHIGIGVGYRVCTVYTFTSYTHYNVIYIYFLYYELYFSLWLKPWLLFPVDDKVEYLQYIVD